MVNRLIVLRLVPETLNGTWMEIERNTAEYFLETGTGKPIQIVATGNVEWDGLDNCAEVYVPSHRLADWKRDHDVDA